MSRSTLPVVDLNHLPTNTLSQEDWERLDTLLRNNQPPGDHENQLLSKAGSAMEKYDHELSSLRAIALTVEGRRRELASFTERYHSLKSPIRRVPTELFIHIFKYLHRATFHENHREFPTLTLSQVCAHWRLLVRSTKALWSFLEVVDYEQMDLERPLISLLETYLTLSDDFPLTLDLEFGEEETPGFRALIRHADRWRSVRFMACSVPLTPYRFPALQDADLYTILFRGDPSVFSTSPMFNTITLDFTDIMDFPASGWQLPWDQLTTVVLQHPAHEECVYMLSKCQQVQNVTLQYVFIQPEAPPRHSPVVSPVSHLRLIPWEPFDKLLDALKLPSLTHLDVMEDQVRPVDGHVFPLDAFISLLSRSSCSVISLYLTWPRLSHARVSQLLEALPTLEALTVNHADDILTDELIRLFNPFTAPSRQPLLPRLTETVWLLQQPKYTTSVLVDVLKSRFRPLNPATSSERDVASLKKARFTFPDHGELRPDPQALQVVRELRQAGMHLFMTGYTDLPHGYEPVIEVGDTSTT